MELDWLELAAAAADEGREPDEEEAHRTTSATRGGASTEVSAGRVRRGAVGVRAIRSLASGAVDRFRIESARRDAVGVLERCGWFADLLT